MAQPWPRLWLLMAFFLAISTSISTSISPDLHYHARSTIPSGKIVDRPEIVSPLDQQQHLPIEEQEQAENENNDIYNNNNDILPRQNTLPTPFDTSIGTNFTSKSCPKFLDHFLASSSSSSSSTTCYPLSMLLRNSYSFFTYTLHSAVATSHLLDITCSLDPSQAQECAKSLSHDLAADLLKPQHCGDDYKLGNPLVVDAYVNLVAYEPVYRASCLKDPATDGYCFVDAVMNSSRPADYDLYFMPFGRELQDHGDGDGEGPSCTPCLKASMRVFRDWARRDGQPLAGSYLPSAKVVNRYCGDGFADLNVTLGDQTVRATSGGGVGRGSGWSFLMVGVGLVLVVVLGDGF